MVDRAAKGERLTMTRSGKPVAELRPLSRDPMPLELILARRQQIPPFDPDQLRHDLDQVLDPAVLTMPRGILDTSTLILLSRLQDTDRLPGEPLITANTLAELSVGPLVNQRPAPTTPWSPPSP